MSVNLLETVQHNLGYPPLKKIDPNTQQVAAAENSTPEHRFSQAAIPAVLTGLFRFVQSDEGAETVLGAVNPSDWVAKIFDDHSREAVKTISGYARESGLDPVLKMNAIANEAVKLVKEQLPAAAGIKEVKIFFSNQKNNILPYLPAALNMGELLHDNTLDDRTNKMEGPISSLMQNIGNAFSNPVTSEEIKKP